MAELKTKPTKASVAAFLTAIDDPVRRSDCRVLARMMSKASGSRPAMWGGSIVGFGKLTYAYRSGRTLEWFTMGFSPRKDAITLYLMSGLQSHPALLKRLGKHQTGKGCLYLKRLTDVDLDVLAALLGESIRKLPLPR